MKKENVRRERPAIDAVAVLIAGAGPVGLALALELGLRGIGCVVVEKRDGSIAVPKMSQVSARNMEFCRRWGIADQVRNAVWAETHSLDFVYLTSLTGRELARQKVPSYAEMGDLGFTPEGPCHCPQIYFDPILAAQARALPCVTFRYNTELESFVDEGDIVRARVIDTLTGNAETVAARYLVGCDGPGGVVRESLGIGLGGLGIVAHSVNIFFRAPGLAALHDKGWARFYRLIDRTGCWGELIAIDGRELWRLTVFEDISGRVDVPTALRRAVGCDFDYQPISAQPWERRDYVADSYGRGHVFIAGDAAHQCSPTGGLGMHTGIEDAVNLGWKLAAMVDGWGGPGLLPSYEAERRPIACRNVSLSTEAYRQITAIPGGDALGDDTQEGERQRQRFAEVRNGLGRFSISEFLKVQCCYENSPICVADGSAPPSDGAEVPSARPGTRAPHGWIGERRSILDLFGDGFTLLKLGEAPPDAGPLVETARTRGVSINEHSIGDPALAEIYERPLVLVRPDGHVAWRGDKGPADALAVIDRVRGAVETASLDRKRGRLQCMGISSAI